MIGIRARRSRWGAKLVPALTLLLWESFSVATGAERLVDPTKAFVEGYDPSGNDFLANVPERTVLLRVRADLDGDGREDLALSDSSTWGNAGGQWLLFRGQSDGTYVYWGTLFFAPGSAAQGPHGELTVYVRTSVSRGKLEMYRLAATGITKISATAVNLEEPRDQQHYETALKSGSRLAVEFCKLTDYRSQPAICWRPGLGLP